MILELLDRSGATEPFRDALVRFLGAGRPNDRVRFGPRCPAIKVQRTLTRVLLEYPDLPIESIDVDAASGCEFFRGRVTLHAGAESRAVTFDWDCKWRAEQEGWRDWFGFPDQARAAREFDWDCFRVWEEAAVAAVPVAIPADEPDAVPA
jgi:hypothetical protein